MLKILKTIIILIILINYLSCQHSPIEVNQLTYFDNKCYLRRYKFSREYLGPIGSAKEAQIEDCRAMIGYSPDDYLTVQEWLEDVRKKINTQD